jgi:CelD/BcsL family acetyltransferase involved in cellulose biosynthesis
MLTMRRWGVAEWLHSEALWSGLLARTEADPLFLSWGWLTHWWQSYGDVLGHPPHIVAFYRDATLVGLAPLYFRLVRRGGVIARSVQLIGLSWRDPEPLISEYLDVIAAPQDAAAVRDACLRVLVEECAWQELVLGLTAAGPQWRSSLAARAPPSGCYVRELDRSISYQANLTGGFDSYLQKLSQSTRRSVWNLRRRLEGHGRVRLEQVDSGELGAGFADLNRLHQLRWSKPAFAGKRLAFHLDLARRLANSNELVLSRLRVGHEVVSVLYDIRKGARQYNIKMAFDPRFSDRLSLGLMHLGYAMEAAADCGVAVYDFLAGPGQRNDYKRHLSQASRNLSAVQILRGPLLPRLYRWYDHRR